MAGSSTILQTLLPGKSGEAFQRGASPRKTDQSFAAVFEKRIQVRQEKPAFQANQSEMKDRQTVVNERREDDRALEKASKFNKTGKTLVKNPAKEKMKELMKKIKDTLETMKDPEITPDKLKELAGELKDTLGEIKAIIDTMDSQKSTEDLPATDNQEILKLIESMGSAKPGVTEVRTPVSTEEGENLNPGKSEGVQKTGHWDNRQSSEIKGNPLLKDLEKVIEAQADIIADDPELKEALKQILADIKAIQSTEVTKPEARFIEKLDDLMNKLNGIVVKAPEMKAAEGSSKEAETVTSEISEIADSKVAPSLSTDGKADTAGQNSSSEDSNQADTSQSKQVYNGDGAQEQKNAEVSDKTKAAPDRISAGIEKVDTAALKTSTQAPLQSVQNPQAFQDTLDAVKEGVQAKTQFQSRIMEQVIETVKSNFNTGDGKSEMIMKLKPESLGNVALKVSIEKGIVLAEFQVESQAVKQALEANLQDLRSALQDKGYNVFNLDVSVRKDNQQQESNQGRGSKNRTAMVEGSLDRIEQKLMSLESVHRESTIDYLG